RSACLIVQRRRRIPVEVDPLWHHHLHLFAGWCPDSEVRIICGALVCELRNRRDTSKLLVLVWLWFRSPHDESAARMMRTSEPPHWCHCGSSRADWIARKRYPPINAISTNTMTNCPP